MKPILLALVCLCAAACTIDSPIAGRYNGGIDFTPEQAKSRNVPEEEGAAKEISLVVNRDGTFELTLPIFVAKGKTRIEGDVVTFNTTDINGYSPTEAREKLLAAAKGKPEEETARKIMDDFVKDDRMRISSDGKRLTSIDPEDIKEGTFYFERP